MALNKLRVDKNHLIALCYMYVVRSGTYERDAVIAITPDLNHDATAVKIFLPYLDTHISISHPSIKHVIVWSDVV